MLFGTLTQEVGQHGTGFRLTTKVVFPLLDLRISAGPGRVRLDVQEAVPVATHQLAFPQELRTTQGSEQGGIVLNLPGQARYQYMSRV